MSLLKRMLLGVVVLLVGIITSSIIGHTLFKRNVKTEVELLFDNLDDHRETVLEEDLMDLPSSVKRWLKYSGIIGKENIVSARLKQQAKMKLDVDGPWMPVDAEQYITASKPGFIWSASIKPFPFVHIAGRDKYLNGRGSMLIKPLSLFTLTDSKGEEIDQGTLLRYLAETVWVPSAVLNKYISWKKIDENNAKATMTYGGIAASGIFTFNQKGEVIRFEAERYGDFNGEFRIETWSISVSDYKPFEGIKVPTKGTITWKLAEGDFTWFTFELLKIEYNNPTVY
ncbi:DUF6544 family protein [Lacticigenium naphthae]|uniref:DUF6544 family protein n=1 Tax=Lacticigenium naphthae TaxID=515351 RepID=UPI0004247DE8|nr:DUF6544 family protein [Lacticigenium naphthae]